jgi:PRC-barrel domain
MIVASRLRRRVLSGFTAASLLTIAAPGVIAASDGPQPAVVLTQDQTQAQHGGAAPKEAVPKPTPPAPNNPEPAPPKNLEPLVSTKFSGILGKKVIAPDGQSLGLVVDVVVNADGHPRAAVIDFGGFLGVGSRKIAVDWRLLTFAPGQPEWQVWLSLSRAEIQTAPEYQPDAATNKMVGPPWEAPASTDVRK